MSFSSTVGKSIGYLVKAGGYIDARADLIPSKLSYLLCLQMAAILLPL
jgi:hypothetical protein